MQAEASGIAIVCMLLAYLGRRARLDSRFLFVPTGAPAGTTDSLVTHMAPQEAIMLDDGAGVAAADGFAWERQKVGDATVLHCLAKPN